MSGRSIAFSKPVADAELPRLLGGFREAGYDGLQLKRSQWVGFLGDPDGARAALGTAPGVASALITSGGLDAAGRAELDATVALAAALGSERVVFCHGHPHDGVDRAMRERFARELASAAADAGAHGVALSLHHHVGQPVMTLEDAREFFGVLSPGELGLTVDTAHLGKAGVTDLPGFVEEFAPFVDNVHLKDFDDDWRLLGDGALDLVGVLDALRRVGYAGWLCVDEETDTPLDEAFRRSREWLAAQGWS